MLRRAAYLLFLVCLLIGSIAAASAAPTGVEQRAPGDATSTPIPNDSSAPGNDIEPEPAPPVEAPDCGPDLVPYTPSGWLYPVTPNTVKELPVASANLFAGKPTYFDLVTSNVGTEPATANYYVDIFVDSTRIIRATTTGMPVGHWGWHADWPYTVNQSGSHTVKMIVDPTNVIAECDETNNQWQRDFQWELVDAWWGEYYNNMNLAGDPVLVRDEFIEFDWPGSPGPGVNADGFSVRWTRSVTLNAETYHFTMTRDNGMRFYFDNDLVYDEWTDTVDQDMLILDIIPGDHTMRVEMFESGGTATAWFERRPCFAVAKSSVPAAGGSVTVSPSPDCNQKYTNGQDVVLTANSAAGYVFSHWSGDVSGTQNPLTVAMQSPTSVTAHFTQQTCYSLTTSANPSGSGAVNANPAPNCAGGKYTAGTVVSLSASANSGYTFANWSGDLTGSQNPKNVTMNGNKNVTANFTSNQTYTITASANPAGGGNVTLTPNKASYPAGEQVEVRAVANSGYVFSNWSGSLGGSTNPATVTMNGNKTIVANFIQECYSLNLSVNPSGSGVVNPSPPPNCGSEYTAGTVVSLSASANSGYTFANWSGGTTGTQNPKNVTMNADKSVTANFTLVQTYTITASANPAGGGNVTLTPNKASYQPGEQVQVRAVANSGYHFASWSGSLGGSTNPVTVTMNGNKSIVANFTEDCYSLSLSVSPSGVGVVNPSPPPNCGSQYAAGTVVSLSAVGSAGWGFANWSGDLSGTQNPKSVTMNGNRSVTARFEEITVLCYVLTLDHTGQGTDPQGTPPQSDGCAVGSYEAGAVVQLTAGPANGWHVAGWRGTANNGATTLNNSLVMPAAAHTAWVDYDADAPAGQIVALPMVLFGELYGYFDELESEPNDDWDQGDGPLLHNRDYRGYPDDRADWYYFDVPTTMSLVIALENITGNDPQLTLYYQDGNPSSRKEFRSAPPYIIYYPAPPGRYYVRVYVEGDFNTMTRYTLRIGTP